MAALAGSAVFLHNHELSFGTVRTTDRQELGIYPLLLFQRLNAWVLLWDFCMFLQTCLFFCKTTGFLYKIHSGKKKKKHNWILMSNTTEFLRCDPFSNNSFLKYSPLVYRFCEEITADGCFTCCALSTPNMNAVLFLKLSPVLFKFYGELILIITCLEKQISLYKNKRDSGF